jgi:catechol 2,3-dioxygenase-like lactoylglutathione lyase family enzyme
MNIERVDHLVLTVTDIAQTCEFYERVLGMQVVTFGEDNRKALKFGQQKLNLHLKGHEVEPKAQHATVGAIDLCLITRKPVEDVLTHLEECRVKVELGIVDRTGANSPIRSIYIRDPDGNLIEIANEK